MLTNDLYQPIAIKEKGDLGQLSRRLTFVEAEIERIRVSILSDSKNREAIQRNIILYQELIDLIKEAAQIVIDIAAYMPGPAVDADCGHASERHATERMIHSN